MRWVDVAYLKVLWQYFPGETQETSGWMTVLGKFGPSTFVILASNIADLHQFMQKLTPKNSENEINLWDVRTEMWQMVTEHVNE